MYRCNLRSFLYEHRISQKELSQRSGLTEAMISRMITKKGMRTGSIKTWFKICEALDCNIYDLWEVVTDGKAEKTKVQ